MMQTGTICANRGAKIEIIFHITSAPTSKRRKNFPKQGDLRLFNNRIAHTPSICAKQKARRQCLFFLYYQ